nr:FAD-binding protein [Tessaracoccus coleopterorum]
MIAIGNPGVGNEACDEPPASIGSTSVVVVGTGAAGLSALLHLAGAGVDCVAVTRGAVTDSATAWAQGGLAAVWDAADTREAHVADTLTAGPGCARWMSCGTSWPPRQGRSPG